MGNSKVLLFEQETFSILGACFEVYKELGCGFLEPVYQEALEREFSFNNIPYIAQPVLEIAYKGMQLHQYYKPDFICFDKIIVELKTVSALLDGHRSQLRNYLKATKLKVGLLINFGHYPLLEHERFIL